MWKPFELRSFNLIIIIIIIIINYYKHNILR